MSFSLYWAPRDGVVPPPVDDDMAVLAWGNNSVSASTANRILCPWFSDTIAETETGSEAVITIPQDGVIDRQYVHHGNPAGNGTDVTYTLLLNGVVTALLTSLPSTASTANNLADSVVVNQGDEVQTRKSNLASLGSSPTNVTVNYRFRPM